MRKTEELETIETVLIAPQASLLAAPHKATTTTRESHSTRDSLVVPCSVPDYEEPHGRNIECVKVS
jgi:hypothetical protein